MNEQLAAIDQVKSTAIDLLVNFGPRLLVAVLVMIAGFVVSGWVARWFERGIARIELEPPVRDLLLRIVRAVVIALFIIMALQNLGVQLLPLLAGVGVAGAGIALAMQGVLGNLVAGLSIIFTKPFRVGEYISIVGEEGRVETITLFSTTLSHPDRSRVIIPNRKIVGEILHDYGTIRQVNVVVGVAYDTDLNLALAAVDEVLRANDRVLKEPAPVIQTVLLGDSSVNIAVKPWVAVPDYGRVTSDINQAILEKFRRDGIVIPFPQREVRLRSAAGSG